MAFKRKSAPSAASLAFPASDPKSGSAATNSKGQVVQVPQIMNWPYQRFTTDNELNPRSNQAKPDQLSATPQAFGDYSVDGGTLAKGAITTTIGGNGMLG
jgi:hypothetical protein